MDAHRGPPAERPNVPVRAGRSGRSPGPTLLFLLARCRAERGIIRCCSPAGDLRGAKTGSPPPSRGMKHAIRRLVLLAAVSAFAAPSAPSADDFGTYTQYACRTPDGSPAPADGFSRIYFG